MDADPIFKVPDYIHHLNMARLRKKDKNRHRAARPARRHLEGDEMAALDEWVNEREAIVGAAVVEDIGELTDLPAELIIDTFWNIIDNVRWQNDHNLRRITEILRLLPPNKKRIFMENYQAYFENMRIRLLDMMAGRPESYVCDVCSHLIASGKHVYVAAIEEPTLVHYFIESGDIKRGFHECVPKE